MKDRFGREIDYLRVSVTDRCNLRCGYCMPTGPAECVADPLSVADIARVVTALARLGVRRVRLTGGEPLMRPDIVEIARAVSGVGGIRYVALTTNAVRLADMAGALRAAGVRGVNLSIDALDAARYRAITGVDVLDRVLRGLDAAMATFEDVKVNCVLLGGADWMDVVGLAQDRDIVVRLIERMPNAGQAAGDVRVADALAALERRYGPAEPLGEDAGAGPASYWRFEGLRGRVGVIGAMSGHFCARCNRVRLTSAGVLRTCLFGEGGVDMRGLLRTHATDDALVRAIESAIASKPRDRAAGEIPGMFRIGG